jgi:flagellar hook-associated protein 1
VVTGDGTMLFDKVARQVSFDRTDGYNAQTIGNGILIDGVPVSMGVGGNTTASGTISAMLQLRDTVAPAMQLQLDEMTRALNDAIPGLMTWSGDINDAGIAGRVRLNADIDPAAGGNPLLLRDGILANGNVDGNASFSDVLIGYLEAFEQPRPFTTASGATAVFSLTNYAADAISWLEANRQEASRGIDTKSALLMRTNSALSNATQVNVDEEMALLLELENSYAASARILQTIDRMLAALLDAAR